MLNRGPSTVTTSLGMSPLWDFLFYPPHPRLISSRLLFFSSLLSQYLSFLFGLFRHPLFAFSFPSFLPFRFVSPSASRLIFVTVRGHSTFDIHLQVISTSFLHPAHITLSVLFFTQTFGRAVFSTLKLANQTSIHHQPHTKPPYFLLHNLKPSIHTKNETNHEILARRVGFCFGTSRGGCFAS
jgi:hypothetical protein